MIAENECKRCGHKWVPRIEAMVLRCPSCQSPYWFKESIRETRRERELRERIERLEAMIKEKDRIIISHNLLAQETDNK